jgi:ubiquinone/menaquinone biosynthesis C-methylase UbiE
METKSKVMPRIEASVCLPRGQVFQLIHKGKHMVGGAPHSPFDIHGFGEFFAEKIKGAMKDWSELQVLDVGTGSAANAIYLAGLVGAKGKVYSVDPSREILQNATRMIKEKGLSKRIKLVEAKAENLPLENSSFDAIVTLMALHHLEDTNKAFQEFSRVLKANGIYVVVEWTSKASAFIPHPATDFLSLEKVRKMLERTDLEVVDFEQSDYSFFAKAQKKERK